MKKKWTLVFLMFAIPLIVVGILHFFGENRFDVPIFHTEYKSRTSACGPTPVPYYIDMDYVGIDSITVVFTYKNTPTEDEKLQMLRIKDRFNDAPVKKVYFTLNGELVEGYDYNKVIATDYLEITQCHLILEGRENVVLLDGNGRIRGYYLGADREDIDRMAVEMEILLTNGENKSEAEANI